MTLPKAIVAILLAAVAACLFTYVVRQKTVNELKSQQRALQNELQQAAAEKKAAVTRANERESELEKVRSDSLALARLREQLKSNSITSTPAQPTGFYLGADRPVFITYGSADPVLRSFVRALMDSTAPEEMKGQTIFEKLCAACHQPDGKGKDGIAPPLVGSEWVLAPSGDRLVRIGLNGLTGPISVQGREWNLPMPSWRESLDDDAIAAVLTYVRSELGSNKADALKPELVNTARQELHPTPETAPELLHIPLH